MQLSKVKKNKARHDTVLHCVTLKTYTYIHVDICMIVKVKNIIGTEKYSEHK